MSREACTCNESYTCASCERAIDQEMTINSLVERVNVLERKIGDLLEALRMHGIEVPRE